MQQSSESEIDSGNPIKQKGPVSLNANYSGAVRVLIKIVQGFFSLTKKGEHGRRTGFGGDFYRLAVAILFQTSISCSFRSCERAFLQ